MAFSASLSRVFYQYFIFNSYTFLFHHKSNFSVFLLETIKLPCALCLTVFILSSNCLQQPVDDQVEENTNSPLCHLGLIVWWWWRVRVGWWWPAGCAGGVVEVGAQLDLTANALGIPTALFLNLLH